MTDNVSAPVATGTVLATDDVGGTHYPRIKISFGADGVAADVTTANPLPVAVTFPSTQAVSATALPLPTGAATSALQTSGNASLTAIAASLAAPIAVTGTFYQATQPISAASLPLPTGAATSALQTTGNNSLAATEPFSTGGSVTPSDTTTITGARGIWVGGAGNVTVTTAGGDVTLNAVPAGTLLPIKATKVKATGTTATNIAWLG